VTATITRPRRTSTLAEREERMRQKYDISLLDDPDAEEPEWIDEGIDMHPDWVDTEIVRRVLAGHYHRVTRKLSHAEALVVIGVVLDEMHAAAINGYRPDRSMTQLSEALGWSGHRVAVLTAEARPKHAERMREARENYRGWQAIADGDAAYRRHRAKHNAQQRNSRAAARRERRIRARAA